MKIKKQSQIYAKIIAKDDEEKRKMIFKDFLSQRVHEEKAYRDVIHRLLKAKKERAIVDDELYDVLKRSLDTFKHSKEWELDTLMLHCQQCLAKSCQTCKDNDEDSKKKCI